MNKTCRVCGYPKPLEEFPSRSSSKDGHRSECFICYRQIRNKYFAGYRGKPEIQAYAKDYRDKHADQMSIYQREYFQDSANKAKRRVWSRDYEKKRRANPSYRISNNFSRRIRKSLNGDKGGISWEKVVGYSLDELRVHLESLFLDGMTWYNYGEWHIDHIRPIVSFNITSIDCDDFKECWSLANLQPLWKIDNLKKRNKWSKQDAANETDIISGHGREINGGNPL